VAGSCEYGNEPSGSKRCEQLADELLATQEENLLLGVRWLFFPKYCYGLRMLW